MNVNEPNGILVENGTQPHTTFEKLVPTPILDIIEGDVVYENHCTIIPDSPIRVTEPVSPFSDIIQGKITCQVETAYRYFMEGTTPDAGTTYDVRLSNYNKRVREIFQDFIKVRAMEYCKTTHCYRGVDSCEAGCYSWKTLTCQEGLYFIRETIVHTETSDWKGGPVWTLNTVKWKTGGTTPTETFCEVEAKYHPEYIKACITEELNCIRKDLIATGIPTEMPII